MIRNPTPATAAGQPERRAHDYDDDSVCRVCGHDGAEWYWWKKSTYEGRASNAVEPSCKEWGAA